MAATSLAYVPEGEIPPILSSEVENTTAQGNFEQTIELLQIDAEELTEEIARSAEELEGLKKFPCEHCSKVCKSKGGLTKHFRSKHFAVNTGTNTEATKSDHKATKKAKTQIPCYVTEEKILSIFREIGKCLTDEKIYPEKLVAEVFNLQPSKSFLDDVNALLDKFYRRNDRNRFVKEYYGKMHGSCREYFHPFSNHKVVFMMLVNLPERLITLVLQDSQVTNEDKTTLSITPEEHGPLAYVAGYMIQALYRKSKNLKTADSLRNQEIQALLFSMKVPIEENEYISSLSRGALWAPNDWLVSIAEIAELCFKKHTRIGKPCSLPVDKVVDDVQASPLAKSLWNNIVEQCDVQVSKECQSLCFENIVKLYATVRGFSFARDVVNKYKLSEKNTEKEGFAETVEG